MNTETYLQHIDHDGRALLEAVVSAPDAAVAACPGWTNRDLAKHMGDVYGFVIAQLRAGNPEARTPSDAMPAPDTGDISAWFRERQQDVIATLRATAPDTPVWTFGPDKTAAFFFRRMAHETVVHRWDAQQAAGALTPIDPELAYDGVNEVMELFMRHRRVSDPPESSLHLHRTDGEGEWMLVAKDGTLTITNEHAKGDAAVRGSAQDLLLYLWDRGRANLDCFGDDATIDAWGAVTP
ncbi:hypothetical protein C2W62_10630 [Candidatus Entotheonella serta]|nr:hypothetical protein C2W62_10630 [Candidatus Entotheonella serta]